MFRIIIGGAASGKSEYAESTCCTLEGERVYLATMSPEGASAGERIARHRRRRQDRDFVTVECAHHLREYVEAHPTIFSDKNVLLEDLPNLVANGMFADGAFSRLEVEQSILSAIRTLRRRSRHLTVVTGDLASDGVSYPTPTEDYLYTLARIQNALAGEADAVIEVVAGLPHRLCM